jgi:site-specific recombinase XerD
MKTFKDYLKTRYRYNQESLARKEREVSLWQKLCNKHQKLETLNTSDILQLVQIQKQNYCIQVVNAHLHSLEQYYFFLIEIGKRKDHPIKNFRIKIDPSPLLKTFLSEKELRHIYENFPDKGHYGGKFNLYAQRNKIIVGLMIFQGLESGVLRTLTLENINLQKAEIHIPKTSESKLRPRKLPLESIQIIDIQNYLNHTRGEIIKLLKAPYNEQKLFPQSHNTKYGRTVISIRKIIQKEFKVSSLKQLRNSRIVLWLKMHNLREVQYKSGYKSLASLEKYKQNELESLKEAVSKYHIF